MAAPMQGTVVSIAVRGNETILGVTREELGLENVIEVGSYAEAAGVLLALGRGISLQSVMRPLSTLRYPQGAGGRVVEMPRAAWAPEPLETWARQA